MTHQLSVQQQNADTKAGIQRAATEFKRGSASLSWLPGVISSRGADPETGILARLIETPEQEGSLFSGLWLTESQQFWEFAVVVSSGTRAKATIELYENVTPSVVISAQQPGTGKSFGFLALEVLNEARGG